MSFLFGKTAVKSRRFVVPDTWTPNAKMKRIVGHWTGGSYTASSLDKEHYHFLIEGNAEVIRGLHSIKDNEVIGSKSQDEYAAHTKGANTGAIGISICAAGGSEESPFKPGSYPVLEEQWQRMAELIGALCARYDIPVTDKTVLTHAEVQTNLGIKQNGKWDISRLIFLNFGNAKACGDDLRRRVSEAMK